MKLIQASAWYPPDSSGGVEVYLDWLTQDLQAMGIDCSAIAARNGEQAETYDRHGTKVYRYPASRFDLFVEWLTSNKADIYHQHTIRPSCGIPHLRLARSLGMKTIVTVHMPDITCLRGTMMFNGQTPCDGRIELDRCGQCLGMSPRVPAWLARSLSQIPVPVAKAARNQLRQSSDIRIRQLATTLYTPTQIRSHREQFQEMIELSDRIVVVSQWLYDAYLANHVPKHKLVLSRLGVSPLTPHSSPLTPHSSLKLGFLGRWQATKGVQVLVEALQQLPKSLPVELIIHATHADEHGKANQEKITAIALEDPRIQIKPPLSRSEIAGAIAGFDLLTVPSQWLETGPLVVLEAHAVGTPVIGSDLGGIAERVKHGIDGWLVPATDVRAWAEAIQYLAQNPSRVAQLKQGIQPVKTTREVAQEMAQLYQRLMREH